MCCVDDPCQFHFTEAPLIEEYSIAAKVHVPAYCTCDVNVTFLCNVVSVFIGVVEFCSVLM